MFVHARTLSELLQPKASAASERRFIRTKEVIEKLQEPVARSRRPRVLESPGRRDQRLDIAAGDKDSQAAPFPRLFRLRPGAAG